MSLTPPATEKVLCRFIDSYMNIKGWLTEIDRYGTEGVHKLILGNKADLVERKVVQFEAAKVCLAKTETRRCC